MLCLLSLFAFYFLLWRNTFYSSKQYKKIPKELEKKSGAVASQEFWRRLKERFRWLNSAEPFNRGMDAYGEIPRART